MSVSPNYFAPLPIFNPLDKILFLAKAWLLGPDERNARHGHLDIIGYAEAGNWSRRSLIGAPRQSR